MHAINTLFYEEMKLIEKFLIRNDPIKYLERLNETQKRSKHKFTNLRKQPTFIKEGKI